MARITIKKRKDAVSDSVNTTNYDILIDGKSIEKVLPGTFAMDINLDTFNIPVLTIKTHVTELEVEGEFVVDEEQEIITERYLDDE